MATYQRSEFLESVMSSLPRKSQYVNYQDYFKHQYQKDFDAYFGNYFHGSAQSPAGVVFVGEQEGGPRYPASIEDAIWFCVANYLRVLEARVIGFVHGEELMRTFLIKNNIPEMDCSKSHSMHPSYEFGLIPSPEYHQNFLNELEKAADQHLAEVAEWIRLKTRSEFTGITGMKKLFFDNIKHFVPKYLKSLTSENSQCPFFNISALCLYTD